ncbi:MAG: spore cortex biosynthesis protein YabQ [Oscillospiraceae bacterium]|nr:spore cortex biosynthesis protein YabQ [Oscillospiraceae bacterium]
MNDVTELRAFFGTAYELKLLGLSVLLGAVLGSAFDLFRAARLAIKHSDIAVFFEDAVFFFVFGMSFYGFCVSLCGGALRAFVLVGMIIGFTAYILLPGKLISRILAVALKTLVKILKKIMSVLCGLLFFGKRKNFE